MWIDITASIIRCMKNLAAQQPLAPDRAGILPAMVILIPKNYQPLSDPGLSALPVKRGVRLLTRYSVWCVGELRRNLYE